MTEQARLELEEEAARLEREDFNLNMKDRWSEADKERLNQIKKRINAIHKEYEEGRD